MTQPRRWFQIHLSTAVLLMLTASLLLWLNLRLASRVETIHWRGATTRGVDYITWYSYGFPLTVYEWSPQVAGEALQARWKPPPSWFDELDEWFQTSVPARAGANLILCSLLLVI